MSDQFHPEAEAEHLETVAYYETQQPGLGASYLAAFEAAFERVCEAPRPTPSSGNRIFAVSACHVFPSPYFFANPKGRCKSLPWRLIAVGRRMGSAGSNKGSERTAHSARFWVVRGFFPCGPQLKPGVRCQTKIQGQRRGHKRENTQTRSSTIIPLIKHGRKNCYVELCS